MIVYNTWHIFAYEIPSFSNLSLGINLSCAMLIWYWPGPDGVDENWVSYMTSEALYDPPSTQEFYLHYFCQERVAYSDPFTVTLTVPTNLKRAYELAELPGFKQKSTPVRQHGRNSVGFSCQKGLHFDKALQGGRIDILATPLDDLVLEGGRRALRVPVPYEEHRSHPVRNVEVDMDEATGRVVVWRWDGNACETKIFVGDLV